MRTFMKNPMRLTFKPMYKVDKEVLDIEANKLLNGDFVHRLHWSKAYRLATLYVAFYYKSSMPIIEKLKKLMSSN